MNKAIGTLLIVGSLLLGLPPGKAQTQRRPRYPLPTSELLLGATYGNGLFVMGEYNNTVLTLVRTLLDGRAWNSRFPQSALMLKDVAFGNDRFVAIAADGRSWTEHPLNGVAGLPASALFYAQGTYLLVPPPPTGESGCLGFSVTAQLHSSTDGLNCKQQIGGQASS